MRTVGQMLKEARENKLLSLEEAEKHTKIRKELLDALEKDNYDKLPPLTFVQGFIKNYGRFLGLDTKKLLAFLRRDFESQKHPPLVLESFSKPLKQKKFQITPSGLIATVVALIVLGFFGYLWFEYRQFMGAPSLELSTPVDNQTSEIPQITIEGKTDPETIVTVNNQEIEVSVEGNFKEEIQLSNSTNKITVVAKSKFGKESVVERTVFVKR